MTEARVAIGDLLARKYRVERVLGQGNMGVVVAATHIDLGHPVALKMMLPDKEQTPELRERFLREARAAVRLKSQHVAKVLDVGTDENDMPYIAMEFLEGDDLQAILKKNGPLPIADAVEYVLQACEAVGEAHAAGIVHRDLKPANMFLTRDVSGAPCIKVLDFGISKVMGAELALTHETQSLGSPLYMSPEALGSAKNVDNRTDIWALGISLYQLVAGKTPFHALNMGELCGRILAGTPTPLAEHRPDAPAGLENVLFRCLERDRDRRIQHVAALAHALAPFAPARSRVYVERIARVVGVDPAKLDIDLDPSDLQATMPVSAKGRAPLASVPNAVGSSQPGLAMTNAASSTDDPAFKKPANPLPIIIGSAVAVVAIGAVVFLQMSNAPAPENAPAAASSSSQAATNPPLPETAAPSVATVPAVSASAAAPAPKAPATAKATATTKPTVKTSKPSKLPDYDERQ